MASVQSAPMMAQPGMALPLLTSTAQVQEAYQVSNHDTVYTKMDLILGPFAVVNVCAIVNMIHSRDSDR